MVEVKLCSAAMKRERLELRASSARTAWEWRKRRDCLICAARRAVGPLERREGDDEERDCSSCGLSVMPLAGGGVVALMSRVEGSRRETS